jgi:hypothetical protein
MPAIAAAVAAAPAARIAQTVFRCPHPSVCLSVCLIQPFLPVGHQNAQYYQKVILLLLAEIIIPA